MEDLIDPSYDEDAYAPSALAQSLMGAAIMLVIGLAFVGAAQILQTALAGLQ